MKKRKEDVPAQDRSDLNSMLSHEAAQQPGPQVVRSQSCAGAVSPSAGLAWGCSWRCSMRLIDLESQLAQLKDAHRVSQQHAGDCTSKLTARDAEVMQLRLKVTQLHEEGQTAQQCYHAELADKEEEVIGGWVGSSDGDIFPALWRRLELTSNLIPVNMRNTPRTFCHCPSQAC